MPRRPKGFWDDHSKRYYARLGEVNPKTGKRRAMQLRHEDGRPIAYGERGAVEAAVARRLAEIERERRRTVGPPVAEVCAAFVRWHADNGSAERTVRDHHYHLTRWCRLVSGGLRVADRDAGTITPEDVWLLDAAGFGQLRLTYASVLACWAWAARPVKGRVPVRMIPSNPLARLQKPARGKITRKLLGWPVARRAVRVAYGLARTREVVAFGRPDRTRAGERLRCLCLQFLAHSGCRPGEAAALEWTDLDLDRGLVVIPAERTKTRKTGRDRRFAIPKRLAQALAVVQRGPTAHPRYVFVPAWSRCRSVPSARELIRWWRERVKPAVIAAGVPLPEVSTLYWLRHEYQSTGLTVSSAEEVSMTAGNSPKVLMDTYAHLADRVALEVAAKIQRERRRAH